MKALWQSFDNEFEPFMAKMQHCNNEVKQEVRLAKAQADRQHQLLELKEQEMAGKRLQDIMLRSKQVAEEIKYMRLQKEQLESRTLSWTHSVHNFRQGTTNISGQECRDRSSLIGYVRTITASPSEKHARNVNTTPRNGFSQHQSSTTGNEGVLRLRFGARVKVSIPASKR